MRNSRIGSKRVALTVLMLPGSLGLTGCTPGSMDALTVAVANLLGSVAASVATSAFPGSPAHQVSRDASHAALDRFIDTAGSAGAPGGRVRAGGGTGAGTSGPAGDAPDAGVPSGDTGGTQVVKGDSPETPDSKPPVQGPPLDLPPVDYDPCKGGSGPIDPRVCYEPDFPGGPGYEFPTPDGTGAPSNQKKGKNPIVAAFDWLAKNVELGVGLDAEGNFTVDVGLKGTGIGFETGGNLGGGGEDTPDEAEPTEIASNPEPVATGPEGPNGNIPN